MSKHALFSELPIANTFKSTAGAGLPSFGGRHSADLHFDTTALKEYVLTGSPGATHDFGASPVAQPALFDIGGPVGSVETRFHANGGPNGGIRLRLADPDGSGNSSAGDLVAFDYAFGVAEVNVNNTGNVTINNALGGTGSDLFGALLGAYVSGGVVYATVNGSVVASAPSTGGAGHFAGVEYTTNSAIIDYLFVQGNGTLAWTPTVNPREYVNRVDTATGTVVVPSVDVATLSHYVLTGNTTFQFAAPQGGESFVMGVQQDATGGHTVTWPASVDWPGRVAPTQSPTATRTDHYSFLNYYGTRWLGTVIAQDTGP